MDLCPNKKLISVTVSPKKNEGLTSSFLEFLIASSSAGASHVIEVFHKKIVVSYRQWSIPSCRLNVIIIIIIMKGHFNMMATR